MKLKIDLTNPDHVVAAAAFFNSLAGVVPGEVLTVEPEAKPARKRVTKKDAITVLKTNFDSKAREFMARTENTFIAEKAITVYLSIFDDKILKKILNGASDMINSFDANIEMLMKEVSAPAVGEEIIVQGKNATGAELKEGEAVSINEEGEVVAINEEGEVVAINEEGEVSLEFLQSSVSGLTKKSKENVPPLRDKLIELGAKRVSSLTTDKYQEFYNFLEPLLIEFKLKTLADDDLPF